MHDDPVQRFQAEEGLTLVELLIVIALVAVVAAIALPILVSAVDAAQTKSTAASDAERAKFSSDWSTSGFPVTEENGFLIAKDSDGNVVARISVGGNNAAVNAFNQTAAGQYLASLGFTASQSLIPYSSNVQYIRGFADGPNLELETAWPFGSIQPTFDSYVAREASIRGDVVSDVVNPDGTRLVVLDGGETIEIMTDGGIKTDQYGAIFYLWQINANGDLVSFATP